MRKAVVRRAGAGVGRDHDHRGGLGDAVGDRGAGDVVVVGGPREAPRVSGVGAGVGVRRVAHVDNADGDARFAVDAGDRVGLGVRKTVVGRAGAGIGRDRTITDWPGRWQSVMVVLPMLL